MTFNELKNRAIEMLTIICLILVGFKCSGSIIAANWSWWLVLSPLSVAVIVTGVAVLFKLSGAMDKQRNGQEEHLYID